MNNSSNNGMRKLRNKMVIFFLVITFVATIMTSILDGGTDYLATKIGDNEASLLTLVFSCLLFNIGVYVVSGFVFYLLTKSEIQKESNRQVQEQNLLYAAIAHDLKTPMTSVQGYSKALADGKIKEEEKGEIYNIIYNKSKSMNSLVDTLFEYSKYGTSEYKLNLESIDLAALVREVIAECYCDFEDYGIELDIDVSDSAVNISADKKELKRAITNLITNTYKHNPSGIKVLVKLHQNENVPELIIADSGNEIPKDMDIFEAFVTENKARSIGGGTGLGLAITKRIIDEHQAKICVREDIPEYTKAFVVTFCNR
ncbi:MAG: HAMP domain-containing histidine kinase [Clostridia bacterium]|nr:HAMP domain-containing histidine kinase [Clostridia bacterium]